MNVLDSFSNKKSLPPGKLFLDAEICVCLVIELVLLCDQSVLKHSADLLQAQVFTLKGAVAPSASTTPSARSDPALDGGAVRDFFGNPARAGGSAGYPWGLG